MVRAMYLLAFHAFLRIGEMSATRSGTTQHILQLSDVEFVSEKQSEVSKLIVTFRTYKHSKLTSPFKLEISKNHDTKPCPVHTLQKYVSLRSSLQGNLFIFSDNCPVTSNYFSDIFNQCLQLLLSHRCCNSCCFKWVQRGTNCPHGEVEFCRIQKIFKNSFSYCVGTFSGGVQHPCAVVAS